MNNLTITQVNKLGWLIDSHHDNGFFKLRINDMIDLKLSPESICLQERVN